MQLLKKKGILIFWGLLLLDCYFILTNNETYRFFSKGLLIPVLAFYVYLNARRNHHQRTKTLLFFALVAAWIGDLTLLQNGLMILHKGNIYIANLFFVAGMGCFFIFCIIIGIIFYRIHKLRLAKCQEAFLASVLYIVLCYQLFKFLLPGLGGFKIPIIVYMLGVGFAVVTIVNQLENNIRKVNAVSFYLPAIVLFLVSDAVLALHTFMFKDVDFLSVVVMLSYGYSMSLFGDGFAKYFKG